MKKLFVIAIVAMLGITSCAKDRTCSCTDSDSKSADTDTYKFTVVKATKGQAKANCVSTTSESKNGTVYKTDCKLD